MTTQAGFSYIRTPVIVQANHGQFEEGQYPAEMAMIPASRKAAMRLFSPQHALLDDSNWPVRGGVGAGVIAFPTLDFPLSR